MTKVFGFWRIVIQLGWAKSLTWSLTKDKDERIFLVSLHILKRENDRALSLILGPIIVTIGFII